MIGLAAALFVIIVLAFLGGLCALGWWAIIHAMRTPRR